jgi:hypothetical protein
VSIAVDVHRPVGFEDSKTLAELRLQLRHIILNSSFPPILECSKLVTVPPNRLIGLLGKERRVDVNQVHGPIRKLPLFRGSGHAVHWEPPPSSWVTCGDWEATSGAAAAEATSAASSYTHRSATMRWAAPDRSPTRTGCTYHCDSRRVGLPAHRNPPGEIPSAVNRQNGVFWNVAVRSQSRHEPGRYCCGSHRPECLLRNARTNVVVSAPELEGLFLCIAKKLT